MWLAALTSMRPKFPKNIHNEKLKVTKDAINVKNVSSRYPYPRSSLLSKIEATIKGPTV
jgi:hypothetical protein